METANKVFLGFGSNLGDRLQFISFGVKEIESLPDTSVKAVSPIYETEPWGVTDQPAFLNAVAEVETALTPVELLLKIKAIEAQAGRIRSLEKWTPRELDIDILIYGEEEQSIATLQVPHPAMVHRKFVLKPLSDIAPELVIPGVGISAKQALIQCGDQGKVQLFHEAISL